MLPLVCHSTLATFQGLPEGAAFTNNQHTQAQDVATKMVTGPRLNIHIEQNSINLGHSLKNTRVAMLVCGSAFPI